VSGTFGTARRWHSSLPRLREEKKRRTVKAHNRCQRLKQGEEGSMRLSPPSRMSRRAVLPVSREASLHPFAILRRFLRALAVGCCRLGSLGLGLAVPR